VLELAGDRIAGMTSLLDTNLQLPLFKMQALARCSVFWCAEPQPLVPQRNRVSRAASGRSPFLSYLADIGSRRYANVRLGASRAGPTQGETK